jgi:hypothetical protein
MPSDCLTMTHFHRVLCSYDDFPSESGGDRTHDQFVELADIPAVGAAVAI